VVPLPRLRVARLAYPTRIQRPPRGEGETGEVGQAVKVPRRMEAEDVVRDCSRRRTRKRKRH